MPKSVFWDTRRVLLDLHSRCRSMDAEYQQYTYGLYTGYVRRCPSVAPGSSLALQTMESSTTTAITMNYDVILNSFAHVRHMSVEVFPRTFLLGGPPVANGWPEI